MFDVEMANRLNLALMLSAIGTRRVPPGPALPLFTVLVLGVICKIDVQE